MHAEIKFWKAVSDKNAFSTFMEIYLFTAEIKKCKQPVKWLEWFIFMAHSICATVFHSLDYSRCSCFQVCYASLLPPSPIICPYICGKRDNQANWNANRRPIVIDYWFVIVDFCADSMHPDFTLIALLSISFISFLFIFFCSLVASLSF